MTGPASRGDYRVAVVAAGFAGLACARSPALHAASAIYFHRRSSPATDVQDDAYPRSADR